MTEEATSGAGEGTDTGQKTGNAGADERASWTADDWTREIDRRVGEAQKKWRGEMQQALAAKEADAETKIAKLQGDIKKAELRASFNERAITAGVVDVVAAHAVAEAKGILTENGCDFDKLKSEHPALFAGKQTATKTAAAAGAQGDTGNGSKADMNAMLANAFGIG